MHARVVIAPKIAKIMATMSDKYLVKMEKALNLWVEDMNRKHVPNDSYVLHQKALSLYEDVSKESSEMSDTKFTFFFFTESKRWLHKFSNRFELKNIKLTEEAASADEVAATALVELKNLIK